MLDTRAGSHEPAKGAMRSVLRGIRRLLSVLVLALPATLLAQETRVVSGVVVDAQSGAPVGDVLVTIQDTDLRAVTDADGRFRVGAVPIGSLRLVLRHVGYGEHAQPLVVGASGSLEFRVRISSRAIELSPLVVEVVSDAALERRASGNSLNVIDRPTIDAYSARGERLINLLSSVPGIHVNRSCVEYRLRANTADMGPIDEPESDLDASLPCREVTIYLDGIPMPEGSGVLQTLPLQDLERIQVLSPSEAGVRYGGGGRGVLLVETRRGSVPETPDERVTITGFGWNEPQPYRWLRVLSISAIGNAATAALTYTALFDCSQTTSFQPRRRCSASVGTGAGLLTGAIGGMVTRWAGRTPHSEGRILPSLVVGTATASIGYALRLHGENRDSDVSRTAGNLVLAVGVPLSLTLADRVFRVLR
jgi:hypothetical protein